MRILLVGDYSSVHLELRNWLRSKDFEVLLMSNGDGYKNFERDIDITANTTNPKSPLLKKTLSIYRFFLDFIGIKGLFSYFRHLDQIKQLKNFDIIQLMNTAPIGSMSSIPNYLFMKELIKNNPKAQFFLLAAGDDYEWATYCLKNRDKTYFQNFSIKNIKSFLFTLKYKYGFFYKQLHNFQVKNASKIVPILLDYSVCYQSNPKVSEIIPIGLSESHFSPPPQKTSYPIEVFHGWQKGRELSKGNHYFHDVLTILEKELGPQYIKYTLVQSVPYSEYITLYKNCDIFLDQCFSMDRGVNGILGMASGKAVVSGFTQTSLNKDESHIGINAQPDIKYLYSALKDIILNTELLDNIKKNAYQFSRQHHHIDVVGEKYLQLWHSI